MVDENDSNYVPQEDNIGDDYATVDKPRSSGGQGSETPPPQASDLEGDYEEFGAAPVLPDKQF